MSHYIDGFVFAIATDRIDEYKQIAQTAAAIWKEHGAIDYWESVGDDLDIEGMVSFKTIAGAKEDETVIFSWVVYPSRAARDKANAAIMADERTKNMMDNDNPPFDCKRMAMGGFRELVHG